LVAAANAVLSVGGTFRTQGTADAPVVLDASSGTWTLSVVGGGSTTLESATILHARALSFAEGAGAVTLSNCTMQSGAILIYGGTVLIDRCNLVGALGLVISGTANLRPEIRNSEMKQSNGGDFITMNSSPSLYLHNNHLFGNHCSLHINGASSLDIESNVFESAFYAFEIGDTAQATIHRNNFLASNNTDFRQLATNQAIDATNNFWDGMPKLISTTASFDTSSPAASAFTDAGPQPLN
jgi:hypothetical protein